MSDKMLQSDDMTGITKQRSQASPIFDSILLNIILFPKWHHMESVEYKSVAYYLSPNSLFWYRIVNILKMSAKREWWRERESEGERDREHIVLFLKAYKSSFVSNTQTHTIVEIIYSKLALSHFLLSYISAKSHAIHFFHPSSTHTFALSLSHSHSLSLTSISISL
jgi:hypothetical protein